MRVKEVSRQFTGVAKEDNGIKDKADNNAGSRDKIKEDNVLKIQTLKLRESERLIKRGTKDTGIKDERVRETDKNRY